MMMARSPDENDSLERWARVLRGVGRVSLVAFAVMVAGIVALLVVLIA